MDELRKADDQAVIYSDVLNYVDRENEITEGRETEKKLLAKHGRGRDPLAGLLKTSLLSYQVRGAIFAAFRGRVILADDMGWVRPCKRSLPPNPHSPFREERPAADNDLFASVIRTHSFPRRVGELVGFDHRNG
jgi:hypothetical protein